MKQIRIKFLICLYLLTPLSLISQNLINNGGFESYNQLPTDQAQADKLTYWVDDMSDYNNVPGLPDPDFFAHSPDFFHTNSYSPLAGGCIHNGGGSIGMYNYELLQNQISIQEGSTYAISFYFRLSGTGRDGSGVSPWNNSSLRILLAKNNITYEGNAANDPNCLNPGAYSDFDNGINQEITEIKRFNYNLTSYSFASGWHYQTFTFVAPGDNPNIIGYFDWMAFEVVSNNTSDCFDGYIFLDDIQLFDFCDTYCASQLTDPPTHSAMPNYMCGNNNCVTQGCCKFFGPLYNNINYFDFYVFDRYGAMRYEYHSYDVKELTNPGYSDFLYEYNGIDSWGNNLYFPEDYIFLIRAGNCNHQPLIWAGWVYLYGIFGLAFELPESYNFDITTCCDDNATYDNIVFPNYFRKDVDNVIELGKYGPGLASVSVGNHATFYAGNYIDHGQYWDAPPGAEVTEEIIPCGLFRPSGVPHDTTLLFTYIVSDSVLCSLIDTNYINNIDSALSAALGYEYHIDNPCISVGSRFSNNVLKSFSTLEYKIEPNPSKGIFNFKNFSPSLKQITIYNTTGQKVYAISKEEKTFTIDLSFQPKGIYFVKIIEGDKVTVNKIIIQ